MKSKFESFGFYAPEKKVSTKELMSQINTFLDLERISGIKYRHYRSESEDSKTIALKAARDCLNNSRYDATDLDIIINTAITRFIGPLTFTIDPPISLYLKKELNVNKAMNFDITNACAGMMTGAFVLDNMIKAGVLEKGMVVSGECITPVCETALLEIGDGIDPQFASLTVGDAGAAFIMDKTTNEDVGIDVIELLTFAEYADLCFGMPSDCNPGIAMYTDALKIHEVAISKIPVYLEKVITKYGLEWNDYDFAIPHQTAVKTILMGTEAIRSHFNKKHEEIPEVLISVVEYGNTASTAIITTLYKALKENKIKENSQIAFLALSSGLVLGFIFAKLGKLKISG
ncbi:MAG: 3-oxoacyl-ACP synthase [Candidatus Heimdallarchaeota archaeon]|nr:3-oxoacyl-ACP synthase [Candidatus Heimdallarchaeota archaeon]